MNGPNDDWLDLSDFLDLHDLPEQTVGAWEQTQPFSDDGLSVRTIDELLEDA